MTRKILTPAQRLARKRKWNQRWARRNPERYKASWRRRNRRRMEARRDYSRGWRKLNKAEKDAANKQFRLKNPKYQIEYRARMKLRNAWINWSRTLAASRAVRREAL